MIVLGCICPGPSNNNNYVTEFWKSTLMVAPETIRIFETCMVLLIAEIFSCNPSYVSSGVATIEETEAAASVKKCSTEQAEQS